jgi:ubiquinone/menaquinone biosynthesis C-methylase UbiE
MAAAAYDEIADWYEHDYIEAYGRQDAIGVGQLIDELLGHGTGTCLEVGCGTGFHADRVRRLGWTPVGVDLSANMLRHARGRLPAVRADATRLPIVDGSVPAALTVMTHTDMPAYESVLREVRRVLRPGGMFVHIGVHPCFCGGFADRTDPSAIVIRPGYRAKYWTTDSWTNQGLRNRVGATHRPLATLLNTFLAAGLTPEHFAEGDNDPTPIVLALRAR